MEAKVVWKGKLSFEGSSHSGFVLPIGTDPAVGGDNDGFRPMELIAIGLAGCTALDVSSILAKKRQAVTHFEVKVNATRAAEHPKVFTEAVIHYTIAGNGLDGAAVLRAIELSVTKYCPAQAMLSKAFPMRMTYSIFEDLADGERALVHSGEYIPAIENV